MQSNDKQIKDLPKADVISTGDSFPVSVEGGKTKQIDYDKLAESILNKLKTTEYSELNTSQKTLISSTNELSNVINKINQTLETNLTTEDLDLIVRPGAYFAGGSNTVLHKPISTIDSFALEVVRSAQGYVCQIFIGTGFEQTVYIRTGKVGNFLKWRAFHCEDFIGATASANGVEGLVPAPAKGAATRYLRSDGTWQVPPDTKMEIQDNLTSASATDALSANQGRLLKGEVDELNSNINDVTNKLLLRNYESGNGSSFNYDFCMVGVEEEKNKYNKNSYFYINASDPVYNFSKFTGVPPIVSTTGYFIGYREVFWRTNKNILVKLTEMYPSPGRQHFRFYNSGNWNAWKTLTPS